MAAKRIKAPRLASLMLAVLLALLAVGCSPESLRSRGGGQGADVGNRILGPALNIHGPVDPLYGEPQSGQAIRVENPNPTAPAK
jgi:hypothetical protein